MSFAILQGPSCPVCGCPDSLLLKSRAWKMAEGKRTNARQVDVVTDRRRCDHCQRVFNTTYPKPPDPPPRPDPVRAKPAVSKVAKGIKAVKKRLRGGRPGAPAGD